MHQPREVPRTGRGVYLAILCLVVSASAGIPVVSAQEPQEQSEQPARSAPVQVAPAIPAADAPLDLFVREIDGGGAQGGSVRILRYGHRGALERPGVLEIPEVGRAFVLHAYDLIAPVSRTVEVRRMPDYQAWLEIAGGSHAITLSERWVELLYGDVVWRSVEFARETEQPVLSAGPLIVTGRGRVQVRRINHDRDRLSLIVENGRFEVFREDTLIAVLGAGQARDFSVGTESDGVAANDGEAPVEGFHARYRRERNHLEKVLEDSTLRLYHGPLSGDALTSLWEQVLRFGPLYASAESRALPGIPDPDVDMRTLGAAVRILGAFRFQPVRRM